MSNGNCNFDILFMREVIRASYPNLIVPPLVIIEPIPIIIEPPPVVVEPEPIILPGLFDARTTEAMAYIPELRCLGGYGGALTAYDTWCIELGVSSSSSLPGLVNMDDSAATVDIGFAPLIGGISTKVTLSTEGGFLLYRGNTAINTYASNTNIIVPANTENFSSINRFYMMTSTQPTLAIIVKAPYLDAKNSNSRWQKTVNTAIFYTEYSYYGSTNDTVKVALKLKVGGHMEIVMSEANSVNSKLQLFTFDETLTNGNGLTPVLGLGGFAAAIPQDTCMIYSTEVVASCNADYVPPIVETPVVTEPIVNGRLYAYTITDGYAYENNAAWEFGTSNIITTLSSLCSRAATNLGYVTTGVPMYLATFAADGVTMFKIPVTPPDNLIIGYPHTANELFLNARIKSSSTVNGVTRINHNVSFFIGDATTSFAVIGIQAITNGFQSGYVIDPPLNVGYN